MEEFVKNFTVYLARGVEILAALIIAYASLKAIVEYAVNVFSNRNGQIIPKDEIRLAFGKSLSLALEFLLGADILKTAIAPTWNEIGQLAAIAVLRTGLNYFLERELRIVRKE
ncbi:MAG: DUF1622 domain-containing protein [Bacteroidia bacterium]